MNNWNKYNVGWETPNDSELVGSFYVESDVDAIKQARLELREANIKYPVKDTAWVAVIA